MDIFVRYTPERQRGELTPPPSPRQIPSPPASEYSTNYAGKIPVPRMLNGFRFFMPYSGWMEVGFAPKSDGFGNADVDVTIVIEYERYWLSLNEAELTSIFSCASR